MPFGDEGVALDPRSAAAGAGAGVAAGSGQSLSTGSLFSVLFSCDTKKEAKSQSRCKVGFLLALLAFHLVILLTLLPAAAAAMAAATAAASLLYTDCWLAVYYILLAQLSGLANLCD